MNDDRVWDDPAWLVAQVRRLQGLLRNQFATNLWRNKQLDDIGELLSDYDDVAPDIDAHPVVTFSIGKLRAILQRPAPATLGPPEAMRVAFHWRDSTRPDGYRDALPGDGFGFCEYVENETRTGLMMQFDCAGILACVDMPHEMLKHTLAKAGYSIWPMVAGVENVTEPIVRDMATRITELERDLKSTEAENERLMARVYAEAEADDPRRKIEIGATFPFVPTVGLVHNPNAPEHEPKPIALTVHLPLPGYPGHHGAVHEMLQAFEVWGIDLQRPKCMHPFEEDCAACRPEHEAIRQADAASEYWKEKDQGRETKT